MKPSHCTVSDQGSTMPLVIADRRALRLQERLGFARPMLLCSILVSWRRAHRFDASAHLRRGIIIPAELMKRQPVSISRFRIRRTLVDESLKRNSRVFILSGL